MDNFLDTCIILSKFDNKDKFHLNSIKFIEKNTSLIISIYQEKKELPFLFYRKEKILTELIYFSVIRNYHPNEKDLTPKDVIFLRKMMAQIRLETLTQSELFKIKKATLFLKQQIFSFIQNNISKKIVPLENIDSFLVQKICSIIKNEADSNIIASAIQEHQENELTIITNDFNNWKKEKINEAIKDTKYKKIPEIKYLFNF